MKFVLPVLAVSFLFISCNMIQGSGRMVTEKRTVLPFDEIESSGSIKVEVTTGVSQLVEVEADDNIIGHVVTSVDDGRLIVKLEEGGYSNITVIVHVTAPLVKKLIASGSGSISTIGTLVNNESMDLSVSGSGSIDAQVHSPEVTAMVSGSGSIQASGRTRIFKADNSGSGSIRCKGLLSESSTVKTSGSGSAHVFASVHLDADLDGSGDIIYSGNPGKTTLDDNGSGNISKQD